jgi:hypothetical protein
MKGSKVHEYMNMEQRDDDDDHDHDVGGIPKQLEKT